ncbi:O-antigen ligase family protein [Clostridium fallax]|uniref:O-antigen ligase-related domain-containing protein n=1 Tax=Clostridium fallax TaxID=1533 RepID=A0A1M4SYB6_9CLOT|nr:O-antigen ligase family protein [Clostridium fallax]SHE37228.1 hypothetical protein SAMN05443638_101237 [Clostridium fallax]SQB08032.1 Lipid A core - O-antigen ligase and related enzymes [Clostridium fallax]
MRKEKLNYYLVMFLMFFTYGLIFAKTVHIKGAIYQINTPMLATGVFLLVFIIFNIRYLRNYIEFWMDRKIGFLIIFIYIVYSMILPFVINPDFAFQTFMKILPLILFIFLYPYLMECDYLDKVLNFIAYIFVIAGILAFIMYALGYCGAGLSLHTVVRLVSKQETLNSFGEKRLFWILTHKSRYAAFCIIGIIIIYKDKLMPNIIKYFGIIINLIDLYLANSMTYLAVFVVMTVLYLIYSKRENIKERFSYIFKNPISKIILAIIVCGIIALGSFGFVKYLGEKRDVLTIGHRTDIWKATLREIGKHPEGIIKMPDDPWIRTEKFQDYVKFTNGHNIFFNEAILNGVAGAILYGIVLIYFLILLGKKKDKIYLFGFIAIILGAMFDNVMDCEFLYIFYITLALVLSEGKRKIYS